MKSIPRPATGCFFYCLFFSLEDLENHKNKQQVLKWGIFPGMLRNVA
jgi:hypothetical protein